MDASVITRESPVGPKLTMDRLVAAVQARGMSVFARIDHAAGAAEAGMPLRPTEALVFGDPRAGTPLMQARQTIGLELPLRALVWEDEAGTTRVGWHPPDELARRFGLPPALRARSEAMETAVAAAVAEAVAPLSDDERLDEALEESFPASDSPAL